MLYSLVREPNVRKSYAVGDVVDERYELRRALGRGTRGTVFEAFHRFTGRTVALKVFARDIAPTARAKVRDSLSRAARGLAASQHPAITAILDGGISPDGTPFIVFEMLTGRTLQGLLAARGKLPKADAIGLALQLCDGLAVAHAAGVDHRDLNTGNIYLVENGGTEQLKIAGFGIAPFDEPAGRDSVFSGALLGNPEYLAPEQLRGFGTVDSRADIYAVGVIMYECLTGLCPDAGIPSTDLGEELAAVIARATSEAREDRPRTILELRRAIVAAFPDATARTTLLGPATEASSGGALVMPTYAAQRRRTARAPYSTPVRILLPTGEMVEGRNEDISEGGMLVLSCMACEPGQRVTVLFAVPIEGRAAACDAVVRWVGASRYDAPQSPRAIGLEFCEAPADVTAAIARYVALRNDVVRV